MSSAMCDNQNCNSSKMNSINELNIKNLLETFYKKSYEAKDDANGANSILECCTKLMEIDYSLLKVCNKYGELCSRYPSQLLILEYENVCTQSVNTNNTSNQSTQRITDTIYESIDLQRIRDKFNTAKYARCRSRFPVPTILYRGKYVCRSSTLSGRSEIVSKISMEYLFNSGSTSTTECSQSDDEVDLESELDCNLTSDWAVCEKARVHDIKLLKRLNIGTIVDLMVEKRKTKYKVPVTSSEKVEHTRYSDFNLVSLPFPGCEFFKNFRDNNYTAEGLIFDWNQKECDANLSVPDSPLLRHLKIEWNTYKEWDVILMTQNYIKYLLKYLQDNTSGILVHCISGWDRTPLFISLLRLSLWADGLIHQSLDEYQILYLTIAYDWMLFGHDLYNRHSKGEEIFFFCFYMLKYLTNDEFSIAPGRYKHKKHTEKVAEDVTTRTEYEPMGGELLFEQDHLRGSNVSLNSISSTISNKSQEISMYCHSSDETNGNSAHPTTSLDVSDSLPLGASASPQARRTSPVTVPASNRVRRTDSSATASSVHSNNSNHSANIWQIVTETGSLKSSTGSLRSSESPSSCGDMPFAHSSVSTIVGEEEEYLGSQKSRAERLKKVRDIFYKVYFKTIGSDVRMGPEPSIGTMVYSMVDKILPTTS